MSVPIKRAPRTYGRPRDTVSEDPSASLQSLGGWSSKVSTSTTFAPHLVEKTPQNPNQPRQSPPLDVADDQDSDEEVGDASGGFQFAWRVKMKEIDEEMPADGDDTAVPVAEDASLGTSHRHSPTINPSNDPSRTLPNSPSLQYVSPVEKNVFGGSLSTLTASPVTSKAFDNMESHSPPPSPPSIASRRPGKRRAIVPLSDEDSEDDAKGSAPRSPVVPHPITTPKSRSSSTPPTSDEEMPSRLAPSNSRSKGKGKPLSSRTQVPPLRFSEEHGPDHGKRLSDTLPTKLKLKASLSLVLHGLAVQHRVQAPTKKDKLETIRDRGRIAGAQRTGLQRAEVSERVNLQNFFHVVQATTTAPLARTATFDDPISSFSSSPGEHRTAAVSTEPVDAISTPAFEAIAPNVDLRPLDQSDDENLPDVGALLDVVKREKTRAEMQQELMAKKLKLAAGTRPTVHANDNEDDDFEITAAASETKPRNLVAERGSGSKHKPSEGRKRQLALGGITLAQQRAKQNVTPSKPLPLSGMRTQEQLSKDMAKLVAQTNAEVTKKKEDEWVKRGGQVVSAIGDGNESAVLRIEALKAIAERGKKNAEAREARMQVDVEDEEDDASDEDWSPQRGSASPGRQEDSDGDAGDADITMVNEDEENEGEDEENEENEVPGPLKGRSARRTRAVIDSDSENDENTAPLAKSASVILRESILQEDSDENLVSPIELAGAAIHRGSASSMDERTEDEGDKENNTHLMYDKSEDKENKAVPRHPFGPRPGLGRQGSLFGLEEGMRRGLSMSPGDHEPMSDGGADENDENDAGGDRRRPLQNLLADEDPFLAEPGPSQIDFAARLKQASPFSGEPLDSPESTLRPSFDAGVRIGAKGFSQFSDDESAGFKGALQPGFSDLFESGTEQQQQPPKRPLGLSASFLEKSDAGLFALRPKGESLGLTQDVDLQPAFDVGDNLRRQADAIFEKEQEFVWEAANKKSENKKEELYVNDHGFLTQTRPDGEEPEIYIPSSPSQSVGTQKSGLLEPQSLLRRPLRTLSLAESEFDVPERSPLRRLAKRTRTPSPRRSSPSTSPTTRPKNAFDLLRREPLGMRAPRPKKPLEKSEFVVDEAQESDDDEMLGFGHKRDDGEEEDGEDLDRTLETLVDDKEMDEDTVAADRVLEKFQEHAHEDDLANEKIHQAVVQGHVRNKRRNRGLGLEDSDEEDSEDEFRARKMRRGFHEPKIGGDVSKLAKDPHTLPFYQVYRNDLDAGDDGEFAYLQETQPAAGEDAEMEGDSEGEPKVLTRTELEERMRELARQEYAEPERDFNDVSWLDNGDSDGEQTRVNLHRKETRKSAVGGEREQERLKGWAKTEARSRHAGTGRASGRNAVTGQQARAKAGGGSLRTAAPGAGRPAEVRRPLTVKPSVLSVVASDRSQRFE
ncbi:hypothetical protein B0H19DRAFT_1269396 [Mycena capillaripes]|nr:hypothetical protein B0H19DRAFT_1269396 [Mycena capillaripes]